MARAPLTNVASAAACVENEFLREYFEHSSLTLFRQWAAAESAADRETIYAQYRALVALQKGLYAECHRLINREPV